MAKKKASTNTRQTVKPKTFENFGNLIYNESFNNPNFFYFDWLLSDYEMNPPNPEYVKMANDIGNAAQAYYHNIPGIGTEQQDKDKFLSVQIKQILQILNLAIEQERINEINFIKNKFELLKQNFDPLYLEKNKDLATISKLLLQLGEGEGIDYITFIALINTVQQGAKNTQNIFQFELNHLNTLEEKMKKSRNALENQIRGLGRAKRKSENDVETMVKSAKKKKDELRVKAYLEHHNIVNLKGFKRYMKNMAAVENKVADWIVKTAKNELENNFNSYCNGMNNSMLQNNYNSIKEEIIKKLTPVLNDKAHNEFLPQILGMVKENIDMDKLQQDLINNFQQTLNVKIEGYDDSIWVRSKNLKLFEEGINKNNADTRSAAKLYDTLNSLIQKLRAQKTPYTSEEQVLMQNLDNFFQNEIDPITNLMQELDKYAKEIEEDKNKTIQFERENNEKHGNLLLKIIDNGKEIKTINLGQTFQQHGLAIYQSKRGDTPSSLKSVLTTIKRSASNMIRDEIVDIFLNQPNGTVGNAIKESLYNTIQGIDIKVKGDTLEELMQGLDRTQTVKIMTGGTNVKNDFIELVISLPSNKDLSTKVIQALDGQINTTGNNTLIEKYQNILSQFQSNLVTAVQKDMQETRSKRQWTNYDAMAQRYFETQMEKEKAIGQILELYDNAAKEIEKNTREAKKRDIQLQRLKKITDAFLNSIKKTIYESSTMKTFRTYQNDIGFVGGSIGSTVASQIDSFDQIFSAAGVPIEPSLKKWLVGAVINCSPISVVGEENKDFIEDYLGGLATFALFNEGGAELQMLKSQLKKRSLGTTNTIMHLYKLNSIYYPGSFVLKQVVANLESVLARISQAENTIAHKNVMITNSAAYNMIPNQKRYDKKTGAYTERKETNHNPWKAVQQKVTHGTKIHILFLAGLLDIVKELHKKMEIELPN